MILHTLHEQSWKVSWHTLIPQKIITVKTFGYIVEKVKRRLSGRKGRILSRAAKSILIQTTTFTIPFYTIQTVKVPIGITEEIENIIGTFLGGYRRTKEIKLYGMETLCQSKHHGGLGFRR